MNNFKIVFEFFILLRNKKKKVHEETISGNSILDCSRKAFEVKTRLQGQKGKTVTYKKKKINKEKKIEAESKDKELAVKSKDYSANDAINYIKENSYDFLVETQFLSEDEDRVTVTNAFEQKQNKK